MKRRNNLASADIDMTPMLDIVFIMLIFFIVTAVFLDEKAIALSPPPPSETPLTITEPALAVYIDDTNRVSVDRQGLELGSVGDRVVRLVGDRGVSRIVLSVSEAAHLDEAVTVYDALKIRGLDVTFKVVEAQG